VALYCWRAELAADRLRTSPIASAWAIRGNAHKALVRLQDAADKGRRPASYTEEQEEFALLRYSLCGP
jgi:hypothetical protein